MMQPPQGSLLESALAHLRSRVWLAASVALVALVVRVVTMQAPPARDVAAIAAMLGRSVSGTVKAEDFVWEERGGFLHDALIGRRVLFLAAKEGGEGGAAMNDLYRANVRLTRGGRPIAVGRVENLTATPRGDERDLVAHGHHAAYATKVGEVVQTITLLDLEGDASAREAKTRSERLRASVESFLSEGSFAGVGRAEVSFSSPPKEARFEITEGALVMALGPDALPAAVGLSDETVNAGTRDDHGIRYQRLPHPVTPWSRFFEETARETLGPKMASRVRRGTALVASIAASLRRSATPPPAELPAAKGEELASGENFPPPRITPQGKNAMPGEGLWTPATAAFPLPRGAADAPPAFFETTLRPDPKDPAALVRLVAMDGRRLDLRPLPGSLAPRSETGQHGEGRIPKEDVPLAVAAFAGGAPDGDAGRSGGVVVERQTLVLPRPGLVTLAVDRFGHTVLGAWPFGEEVPTTIRSLRQAGAPLVAGGRLGAFSEADTWPRERSAVGVTNAGHIIYAWGKDLGAEPLARALRLAGCHDAIALATSPDPVGIGFLSPQGAEDRPDEARLLHGAMSFTPSRAFTGSPTELVYVVARKMRPDAPLPEGSTWEPDPGRQPPPTWQPAIHTAKVTKLGADVRLLLFAPERFVLRVRAGTKELSHRLGGTFPTSLDEQDRARLSAAIGLGTARRKAARGLAIGGAIGLRFGPSAGALVVENGRARIDQSESVTLTPDADAVELPMTADEGHPLPESRIVGSLRPRAALCVRDDGSILVASTTFDTDEATTEALVDAGCTRVVALDRGSHPNAFLQRAGTDAAPEASSEQTTLFFLDGTFTAGASFSR